MYIIAACHSVYDMYIIAASHTCVLCDMYNIADCHSVCDMYDIIVACHKCVIRIHIIAAMICMSHTYNMIEIFVKIFG